jgi:hypothetical protein
METTINTLSILPSTKDEIQNFSIKIISELESGMIKPLDLLKQIKCFEKVIEQTKDTLLKMAREEAEKYGAKSFEYKGVKIELAEVGTKYDYSQCNDFVLAKVSEDLSKLNESKKQRETFLKSLKEPINLVDEESGDVIQVLPPIKSSTSSLKVTI